VAPASGLLGLRSAPSSLPALRRVDCGHVGEEWALRDDIRPMLRAADPHVRPRRRSPCSLLRTFRTKRGNDYPGAVWQRPGSLDDCFGASDTPGLHPREARAVNGQRQNHESRRNHGRHQKREQRRSREACQKREPHRTRAVGQKRARVAAHKAS
jgi:hypothetical protein